MLLVAAIAVAILLAPLLLIYLVFDDIYTTLQGGDSILSRFIDKVGGKGASKQFVQDVKKAFNDIFAAIGPILPQLEAFAIKVGIAIIDTIPYIVAWGGAFLSYVAVAIDSAITSISQFGSLVGGVFGAVQDLMGGHVGDAVADIKDALAAWKADGAALGRRAKLYAHAGDVFDGIVNPTAGGARRGQSDASRINDQGGIAGLPAPPPPALNVSITHNINGAKDPRATASAVSGATVKALKPLLRNAYQAVTPGMPTTGQ